MNVIGIIVILLIVVIVFGTIGFNSISGLSWPASLHNTILHMTGLGPSDPMRTPEAKFFSSAFALIGVTIYLMIVGVVGGYVAASLVESNALDRALI